MKKKVILIIIFVTLAGGGSCYFFHWRPKYKQLKEEKAKELALTSPHFNIGITFEEWKIECNTNWRITPKDTAKSSTRTCIWTIKFINHSLDSIYYLYQCEFILKDRNEITIKTDPFYFEGVSSYPYYGYPLEPGKDWEAHGVISLSEIEAQMVDYFTTALTLSCRGRLADKDIREKRKKEFLQDLEDIEKQIATKKLDEYTRLTLWRLGIIAKNSQWEAKIDSLWSLVPQEWMKMPRGRWVLDEPPKKKRKSLKEFFGHKPTR